jgi:tol-pal system protein YbgF
MRRARFFVVLARLSLVAPTGLALGCAGTAAEPERPVHARAETTSGSDAESVTAPDASSAAALVTERDARDRRIAELESRLALSTAEARDLRAELDAARERHGSVRIGEPTASREDDADLGRATSVETEPAEDDGGGRPVLRLYGAPPPPSVAALPGPVAPPIVPPPPPGALDRLPVVMTPGEPDSVPAIPLTPVVVATAAPATATVESDPHDPIALEYRAALAHVSQREWDQALSALGRFVTAHPSHPYADNAMYWRGEVLYAQRDYPGAIAELSAMIERFPHGNKVPDALLRIGFSYQRLGERERAREIFRRVREQFPGTVAARTASREDA